MTLDTLNITHLLESATAEETLLWAARTFGQKLALVTSFQITGIVTLHKLQQLGLKVDVLTLDTGLLFPETYALMEEVEAFFGIEIKRIRPRQTVAEQESSYGPELWTRQPNRCCHYRKVVPLREAIEPYDAWLTGLRRDQGPSRTQTPIASVDERYGKVKIAPFANWREEFMWEYIHAYNLPYNPLHGRGYPSIGCHTCTAAVHFASTDKRAGRWQGQVKTECGLHVKS